MKTKPSIWAIIVGAGIGARIPGECPKQYRQLAGKTVFEHSISSFTNHPDIRKTVVVIAKNDEYWHSLSLSKTEKIMTAWGGEERYQSVFAGLTALKNRVQPTDWVLVHDAARPCLRAHDLNRLIETLYGHPIGGLLATPVRDTLKKNNNEHVSETISREHLWSALTPQMFRYEILYQALEAALMRKQAVTDEAAAVELLGKQPMLVKGSADNIKITYPEDLLLAEAILETRL